MPSGGSFSQSQSAAASAKTAIVWGEIGGREERRVVVDRACTNAIRSVTALASVSRTLFAPPVPARQCACTAARTLAIGADAEQLLRVSATAPLWKYGALSKTPSSVGGLKPSPPNAGDWSASIGATVLIGLMALLRTSIGLVAVKVPTLAHDADAFGCRRAAAALRRRGRRRWRS